MSSSCGMRCARGETARATSPCNAPRYIRLQRPSGIEPLRQPTLAAVGAARTPARPSARTHAASTDVMYAVHMQCACAHQVPAWLGRAAARPQLRGAAHC